MSKDQQEDLQNLNLDYLDEMSLPEVNLKKAVSQPPPGFYFHDGIKILPNKEEDMPKKEETKEYIDIIKKMKRFNPRLAEEYVRKSSKGSLNEKDQINNIMNHQNEGNEFYYQPFPNLNGIPEKEFDKESQKQEFNPKINFPYFNQFNPNEPPMDTENYYFDNNSYFLNSQNQNLNFSQTNNIFDHPQYANEEEKKNLKLKFLAESKKMQSEYEHGPKEQREEIFKFTYQNLFQMIADTYNNYVVQKIFEIGDIYHKVMLLEKLKNESFLQIATHKFGCRVIQKTIEAFNDPSSSEYQYLRNFIFHFLRNLIDHENGSLVVQKCLEKYHSEDFLFILNYINDNFKDLAYDKNGCLIIQKLFDIFPMKENGQIKHKLNETIMNIIAHSFELSKKSYSNYIIQHLLETGLPEHKDKLLNQYIKPNFIALSCDQFASNVAEKSIINSDKEFRKNIWIGFMKNNDEVFLKLTNDKYGNYVMQRIYEYAETFIKGEFENMIQKLKLRLNTQGNFVARFIQNQSVKNI